MCFSQHAASVPTSTVSQDSSLRLVPSSRPKAASIEDTANGFGLHDTLSHGPRSLATEVQTVSTIKDRLEDVSLVQHVSRTITDRHAM